MARSKLEEWRKTEGFSLQEVADLTSYSKPTISRIERGVRDASPGAKADIARRLRVRIADLFSPS